MILCFWLKLIVSEYLSFLSVSVTYVLLHYIFSDKIKNIPVKADIESTKISIQEKKNLSCERDNINITLQKQYEKYKKKELSKEVYLQEKQNLLLKKQEIEEELEKESILKPSNEISNLSDNGENHQRDCRYYGGKNCSIKAWKYRN